ncbi:MAG TPA: hypothetical protein VMX74_15605 [Pirellulales bacterium]|nr:hypothetical protein [Pirellulales bacterium]
MLNPSLQQFQHSPFVFLLIIGLALAFHAFSLNWASSILLPQSISYMRSAVSVFGLVLVNLFVAYLLQGQHITLTSPIGIATVVIISTAFLSMALPSDPVNSLLILLLSSIVTVGGGIVFLTVCERAAAAVF